jgi:hypothetical protein
MPMRARSFMVTALLFVAGPAFAGAWTIDQGKGQVTVTATASRADESFDDHGRAHASPRYQKLEVETLLEYGAMDRLTVMLGPSFQHIDIAPPTDASRSGAGYTEFGARYRILQAQDWVFSMQGLMRMPGTSDIGNPAAIGYTGMEFDTRALIGKAFKISGLPAFIDLEFAQRIRESAPNEFRADATFGIRPAPRWLLLAQSFTVTAESGSALFPPYNYSKLQLSAVYDFTKNWSVQLGGFATVFGHNALQENGLVGGVGYRF